MGSGSFLVFFLFLGPLPAYYLVLSSPVGSLWGSSVLWMAFFPRMALMPSRASAVFVDAGYEPL